MSLLKEARAVERDSATSLEIGDPESLHAYRKSSKSARYLAEMEEGSAPAQQFAKEMKKVLDAIGAWHDWMLLTQLAKETVGKSSALVKEVKKEREVRCGGRSERWSDCIGRLRVWLERCGSAIDFNGAERGHRSRGRHLGVKHPHQCGTLNQQAGLDPVGIGGEHAAKRALGEAQPQHPRDRQAGEEDPVVPSTPPDTGDGEFE